MRWVLPGLALLLLVFAACSSDDPYAPPSLIATVAAGSDGVYLAVPRSPAVIGGYHTVSVRQPDCEPDDVDTCREVDLLVTTPDGTEKAPEYPWTGPAGEEWRHYGVLSNHLGDYGVRVVDTASGQEYAAGGYTVINECPPLDGGGCMTITPSPSPFR